MGSNEACSNAPGLGGALALASLLLGLTLLQQPPARAEPQTAGTGEPARVAPSKAATASASEICRVVTQAASDNGLPLDFFTRLIWQESRFNPDAISPKGAQGIAQFMPGTASGRGLANPFEPMQALREAASYLRELRTTFRGSLGLAAAAYNAGPAEWRPGSPDVADCRAKRAPMCAPSPGMTQRPGPPSAAGVAACRHP